METKLLDKNKDNGVKSQKSTEIQEQKTMPPKTPLPVQNSVSVQTSAPIPASSPAPLVDNIEGTEKIIDTNTGTSIAPVAAVTNKIKKKKSKLELRNPFVAKIALEFNLDPEDLKYNRVIRFAEKRFVPTCAFLIEKIPPSSRKYGILKIKEMVRKEMKRMKKDPLMSSNLQHFLLRYLSQFEEYLAKYNKMAEINIAKKVIDKVNLEDINYILSKFEFYPW